MKWYSRHHISFSQICSIISFKMIKSNTIKMLQKFKNICFAEFIFEIIYSDIFIISLYFSASQRRWLRAANRSQSTHTKSDMERHADICPSQSGNANGSLYWHTTVGLGATYRINIFGWMQHWAAAGISRWSCPLV